MKKCNDLLYDEVTSGNANYQRMYISRISYLLFPALLSRPRNRNSRCADGRKAALCAMQIARGR